MVEDLPGNSNIPGGDVSQITKPTFPATSNPAAKFSKFLPRFSNNTQLDRAGESLVDLAKLFIASTFIGFFFPASTGGRVDPMTFLGGTLAATLLFIFGLKITPPQKL